MNPALLCGRCHPAFTAEGENDSREKGTHVTPARTGPGDVCLACHTMHKGVPGTRLLKTAKSYACLECHRRQNPILEEGGVSLAHPEFERVPRGRLEAAIRLRKFYVGPAGEIACRTCHAVHGAIAGTPLLAAGFSGDESCLWCHGDRKRSGHSRPGREGTAVGCTSCHPVHGIPDSGADPWKTLCTTCHSVGGSHVVARGNRKAGKPTDLPLFDSRGRTVPVGGISCPTCHDPHGAPSGEKRTRKQYGQSGFLCTACHREEESIALTPHDLRGIAGKSVCEPCHKPHGGTFPGMWGLPSARDAEGDRCRTCHRVKGIGTPVSTSGHPVDVVVMRPLPPVYPLFGEGFGVRFGGVMTCASCHDVHGTGFLPQGQGTGKLLRAFGAGGGAEGAVEPACLPCHPERKISHGNSSCSKCHPPHRKAESCGVCHRMAEIGIAGKHAAVGKECSACHRLHGKGEPPRRTEAQCLDCHSREAGIAGSAHGEVGPGKCGPCHPAHSEVEAAPTKARAWNEVFTADAVCARCHREGGDGPVPQFAEHPKNKRKVPTTYGATVVLETPIVMTVRLQDGGRPLFPLFSDNGARSRVGRPGCLTCHDPHAGPAPDQAARKARGYLRDPSGAFLAEICSSCHRGDVTDRLRRFHVLPRSPD